MNSRSLTLVTAGVLILALLGFVGYRLFLAPDGEVKNIGSAGIFAGQPTLGLENAPVKLILFENFLCDHCKTFEAEVFPRIRSEYIDTGRVEAFYINLAWGSDNAVKAGLAGECAFQQNATVFWDYKTALYAFQADHSGEWATTENFVKIAREATPTLDADALRTCIEEERYLSDVQYDLALGESIGVRGTPSVLVGDLGFEGPTFMMLATAIDEKLAAHE